MFRVPVSVIGVHFCFVFLMYSVPVMQLSVKIVFIPQGFIKLHFFYLSFAVMFGNMSDDVLISGFSGGGAQVIRVRNIYFFNFGKNCEGLLSIPSLRILLLLYGIVNCFFFFFLTFSASYTDCV